MAEMKNETIKRDLLTLEIQEFADFEGTITSKMINTHNLAKLINERLQPVFDDYRGSFISPMPNGAGIGITLIFNQLQPQQITEESVLAFKSTESARGAGGNIAERSRVLFNSIYNGRKFQITDDAAHALGVLFRDPAKINWNSASGERYNRNGMGQGSCNYINGLDINKVLEMIYGSRNDDGVKIFYRAQITSPIGNNGMQQVNNWLMRIDMMTEESGAEMCQEAGVVSLGDNNCVVGY